jgi:pimeloyl-ACP methyl ester carboxylesterase
LPASNASAGYFRSGLPYNRFGQGPRPLVVFQGLMFENKPLNGPMARFYSGMYGFLKRDFTAYLATRRAGLPAGCSMKDMSDDYAVMIREEFGGAVDVMGISTGGSLVQHFAADHPDLVHRLVIHSCACTMSDEAKRLMLQVAALARERQWRQAYAAMFGVMLPRSGAMNYAAGPLLWAGSFLAALRPPRDPSDLVTTIEAEDKHDFRERLAEIAAPTLVVAGDRDPFYTEALFRETAAGIPNARLILYPGMGHPASGKRFGEDVLAFLKEGRPAAARQAAGRNGAARY